MNARIYCHVIASKAKQSPIRVNLAAAWEVAHLHDLLKQVTPHRPDVLREGQV